MGKSMEKKSKSSVLQWVVPFAVPMIIVVIILFNFSAKSNAAAKQSVADDLCRSARRYAEELSSELEMIGRVIRSVCTALETDQTLGDVQIVELVKIAADCTEASRVELCDRDGNGVDQLGNKISIGNEEYFRDIQNSDDQFLYIEGNSEEEERSIVVVERIRSDEQSYMLLFYPVEKFDSLLSEEDLNAGAFLALLDKEGRILSASGAESAILSGGNLLDSIQSENPEAAEAVRGNIAKGLLGMSDVKLSSESRVLVYAPLGKNQWGIVLGDRKSVV